MRNDLELQLDQLVATVTDMSQRVESMLSQVLLGLELGDVAALDGVPEADDAVDDAYEQVQHGVLTTVALHAPVAGDLRLLTALLHVSLHLERMADYAVSSARTARRASRLRGDEEVTAQLLDMGHRARGVAQETMTAFLRRDADAARLAAELDDAVDDLNLRIFRRLVGLAGTDDAHLEWASHMIQLARGFERFADHGVDIAEQTIFVVTGKHVELSSNEPRGT